jgi:uncharacterized lipoprotein
MKAILLATAIFTVILASGCGSAPDEPQATTDGSVSNSTSSGAPATSTPLPTGLTAPRNRGTQ